MNRDKAAAVAASAWNSFEASHGRSVSMTPADVMDEVDQGEIAEVIHRLEWYEAQGGGLYSPKDARDAINEYESLDSGCPECARSFGPHYRGPCTH